MEDKQIIHLLEKRKTGTLSPREEAILESWYNHEAANINTEIDNNDLHKNLKLIGKRLPLSYPSSLKIIWPVITVAAAALIILSFGGYFLSRQKKINEINTLVKNDIAPGKNKATLTLANGKKVILSDAANGKLATEAGVSIKKTKNGELIYVADVVAETSQASPQFNTLETARGEQYQVILPDGSHVWLNAASSLKYPVTFAGKERLVELTGEAYFEVAHNKNMPFKVKTQQQEVEVLGTHFNINAYDDEKATATTLIEGSVKVTLASNNKNTVIKPGQQAMVHNAYLAVQQVDTDDAIAWKNGYFQFNDENLENIMRQISRWYDVDVQYQDNTLKAQTFGGTVSRYKNVSEVIKTLEFTNAVHFEVEGKRIVVTN